MLLRAAHILILLEQHHKLLQLWQRIASFKSTTQTELMQTSQVQGGRLLVEHLTLLMLCHILESLIYKAVKKLVIFLNGE